VSFLKTIGLLLIGLVFSANVDARLLLIVSQESGLYQEFIAGFNGYYKGESVDVEHSDFLSRQPGDLGKYSTIVVAGVSAAEKLAGVDVDGAQVIYTMMPLSSYRWLRDNTLLSGTGRHKVLYIDQPVHRFVSLAKEAFPHIKSLGFLHGDVSAVYVDELKNELAAEQIELVDGRLIPRKKGSGDLKSIFAKSDALLLLPDPHLYNRRSVQKVLLASFRYKRPLISYSESFVKAGALLGLFSTPRDIGMDTADLAMCRDEKCRNVASTGFYPKHFSVLVNSAVARQLGIKIKSSEELQGYLEAVDNAAK